MIWLYLAVGFMMGCWLPAVRQREQLAAWLRVAFLAALFVWLWHTADVMNLGRGEEGLLKWFAWGLGIALVGETLAAWRRLSPFLTHAALFVSILCYAIGLDFLRQDAYARVPAAVVGLLVLLVTARVIWRLWNQLAGSVRWQAAMYAAPFGLLVYAAGYKMMDRGWALPWSYLVNAGALSLTLSQLWWGWGRLKLDGGQDSSRILATQQIGHLMLVVSALFHYKQYF